MYFVGTMTFTDSEMRTTSRRVGIVSDNVADAKVLLDDIISAMADVSDARITKASLTYEYDVIDAESGASNVDAGMTMRCLVNPPLGPDRYAPFRIPAPELSIMDGKGGCDMSDVDLIALETALKATGVYVNNATVVSFVSGKLDK